MPKQINITILPPDKRSYFGWNTPFYLLLEENNYYPQVEFTT